MSEQHLLDILAARHGCFISDLNLTPFLRRAALSDLCGMDENGYPLSQSERGGGPNGRSRCATLPGMNGILPA